SMRISSCFFTQRQTKTVRTIRFHFYVHGRMPCTRYFGNRFFSFQFLLFVPQLWTFRDKPVPGYGNKPERCRGYMPFSFWIRHGVGLSEARERYWQQLTAERAGKFNHVRLEMYFVTFILAINQTAGCCASEMSTSYEQKMMLVPISCKPLTVVATGNG